MTDLSALSDAQLQALYSQPQAAPDVSKMSDADLMTAYHGTSMGEDAAKSVAAGLGSGTIGTLGFLGDMRSLASRGIDAAGEKLGFDPSIIKKAASAAGYALPGVGLMAHAPTSQDIRSTITDPIVAPEYKPQTGVGEVLKKGAEFAPNMLLGGPEGLGARFLTNIAVPAIGSEIGEKLGGPVGGVVGALAGGVSATSAARKFQEMAAARNAAKAIPSADELLSSGSKGFEAVKGADTVIKPSSIEQMAKDIKTEMLNEGKHPTSEGQAGVFAALDRLEAMGQAPGGVTPKDMEVIRRNLVDLKPNLAAGPTARMASDKFMEKYSNLGANDLLNGSNPFPTLKGAIEDWAAGKRSNTVQGKVDLAALNSGTAGSGANQDNNLRQAIKQLARPMNNTNVPVAKKLGFNDQEIAAIKQAATGTTGGNIARFIGKAAPTGIVSADLGMHAGSAMGGPVGAAVLPAAGYIAKKIGDLSTKKAVAAIDSLVRSRSPLAAQVAASLPPQIMQQLSRKTQALLTALVAADPILSKQFGGGISQAVGQPSAQ